MDEFFRIINSDRFDGMAQIQYKNTDGYDYYLSNLKKLLTSSMSYKDKALSVVIEQGNNPYLVALLDSVIKSIASSPVQSVKQDVHTSFSEVFKVAKDALDKKNMDDLK